MILKRTISLLFAGATIIAFSSPSLAQYRDTRPDTHQATYRDGKDSQQSTETVRLPKPTEGFSCTVLDDDSVYVLLKNETGNAIPPGSVVTVYLQPANVQSLYKLETSWPAGQTIGVHVDGKGETAEDCSVKVTPGRGSAEPVFSQSDEPRRKMKLGFHETLGLTCVTYSWKGVNSSSIGYTNTSDKIIPKGTVVTFTIQPSGQTLTMTFQYDLAPGETLTVDALTGTDADQLECDVIVDEKLSDKKPAGDKLP